MPSTSVPVVEPLSGPTGRLVATHWDDLHEVLRRHGVTNARLFGSVARGDDHEGSDVDILVDFAPGTTLFGVLKIQDELESILGVEVDLIPDSGLKDRVRVRVQRDKIAL
jgi:predicted nucleotidyltransferase